MARPESDEWGWIGGSGRAEVYGTGSEPDRRQPPSERPVAPPTVDYDYDQYTPVERIYRAETVESFKVVFQTPDGGIEPGIFKRFRPPDEDDFESLFYRRIGMWRSIDGHEAILPVVDWGADPTPWVVTAYEDADGVAELGRNGRLDAAVWTLSNVAESLCFAHRRGVIHGGLTPGSIVRSSIFTEPNAWRFPRVTDWGYVSLLRGNAALESVSARYLAPEHVDPESSGGVDGVTDVYGFGVVAYEALVGRPPFGPDSEADEGFSIPAALDRRFPEIESFLRRCLADRKPERFQTVEEMTTAFRAATGDIDG
jgi:serine/threonine protein kinase